MTFVKLCGITRREDVDAAVELGCDALGFILVPESPRALSLEDAAALAELVPEPVRRVAVMKNPSIAEVEAVEGCGAFDCIQLHGSEPPDMLRGRSLDVIKAFSVSGEADLERTADYGDAAFFLFDSKKRTLGKGEAFDHALLQGRNFFKPFLLAGGLGPFNLRDALKQIRPFGVDLNSGVESAPGVKDRVQLAVAVATVRNFDFSERREQR